MVRLFRRRWLGTVVAALGIFAGCQQHHFISESDYKYIRRQALTGTTGAACEEHADLARSPLPGKGPRTVMQPEGTPRDITLAECMALALERGRSGELFEPAGSRRLASGVTRGQPVGAASDSVGVFLYDPAIQSIDVEQALSKFDAFYRGGITWNKVDRPVGNALDSFQGAFSQINAIAQDTASFQNSLVKPLATGGLAGISFNTDYEFTNLSARVNPSYRPVLGFSVEQPLLRNFGVGINQLLDSHPGGIRTQVPVGGRVPGILISRINAEESQIEFERRIMTMCFAVEEAYWQLVSAYWDKYSREIALYQSLESWNIANAKYKAGSATLLDLKTVETQYRRFQTQYLAALGSGAGQPGVLEAERKLRYLIGLPPDDGMQLIPVDTPTRAPFAPDWGTAVNDALAHRPDLRQLRLEITRSQFEVLRSENSLLPDLRTFADYQLQGLGSQLDGAGVNNAFTSLTRNQFQNWSIGVIANMPLGFRSEHSDVHRNKLLLAQRMHFLQDREEAAAFTMQQSIQRLVEAHRRIEITKSLREAASVRVTLQYQSYKAGKETINFLLDAQRELADALRDEIQSVAEYNISLANFEQQKGTLLNYNSIKIAEGPMPECVTNRASEHIRQRMGALVVQEAGTGPLFEKTGGMIMPTLSAHDAPTAKELVKAASALPKLPAELNAETAIQLELPAQQHIPATFENQPPKK